jgi:hypothetical protein
VTATLRIEINSRVFDEAVDVDRVEDPLLSVMAYEEMHRSD